MARSTHPTPFLARLALGELYEGSIGEVHWAIMVFSHQGVQYGHICIVNGTNSDRPRTQKCPCGFNLTAILTNEMKQLSEDSRRSHERQKELSKGLYTCAMPTIIAVEKSEEPVSIKPLARIPLG